MVYKHAVIAAFCVYDQHGEDAAKRGGWRLCIINSLENYKLLIMGKSWNFVFEFLWEPCSGGRFDLPLLQSFG